MYQGIYEIISNNKLTESIFEMVLEGDTTSISAPGQFLNIKLDGFYLRRPISICDYDDRTITIIYKVVGEGTEVMSKMNRTHGGRFIFVRFLYKIVDK